MKTILIGYDLNKDGQNYPKIIERIEKYPGVFHALDSTWLVNTNDSADTVAQTLRNFTDANDEIMVLDVTDADWSVVGFTESDAKWLQDNV